MKKNTKKTIAVMMTTMIMLACTACNRNEPVERDPNKVSAKVENVEKWKDNKFLAQVVIKRSDGDVGHYITYLNTSPEDDVIKVYGGDLHQAIEAKVLEVSSVGDSYEIIVQVLDNGPKYHIIRSEKPEYGTTTVAYDELELKS